MKKYNTVLAIMLAVMLPLISYLFVKKYSSEAVHMPLRYFFDSVKESQVKGKIIKDTIWHTAKTIKLVNQFGENVSFDDLKGKILLIDFFFTRCPSVCPSVARAIKKLQTSFRKNDSIVQFISITVDPAHDSVAELKKFADKYKVDPASWWLVTGDRKEIYDFALNQLKANIADVNVDTAFVHTSNLFLLDKERVLRGWYDALDSVAQKKLVRDIPLLMLEKDRKKTFSEFLKELFGRS